MYSNTLRWPPSMPWYVRTNSIRDIATPFLELVAMCLRRGLPRTPVASARMFQGRAPQAIYLAVGDSTSARFDGLSLEGAGGGAVLMKARWQAVSRLHEMLTDGKSSEYPTRIVMEMRYVERADHTQWAGPRL